MQRREFLQLASAAGMAATFGPTVQAADAAPASTVRREASDRFVLDFAPAAPRPLKLLQFTDTHFGNNDVWAKLQDKRSFKEISQIVKREQPDLIVHTGDFINNDKGSGVSFEAIEMFDSLGVPWTHAIGNHDHGGRHNGGRSVAEFRQPMKQAAVGEFREGDVEHYAFRFDVKTPGQSTPACSLYCFDSGVRDPDRKVSRPQLDWFERQMLADAAAGIKTPAWAFIHIPIHEFETMRAAGKSQGNFGEDVCFDSDRGETFASFKKSSRVKSVFSGHDHKNDYAGKWEDIELVYGRVSGWSAYGELRRGGRLIEINLADGSYSHKLVFPEA